MGDLDVLVRACLAGFGVLGGLMATFSGHAAAASLVEGQPRELLAEAVDRGLGIGFILGVPAALWVGTMTLGKVITL